jgi:hypothetical protein
MPTLSIGSKEKTDFSILGLTKALVWLLKVALNAFPSPTSWQKLQEQRRRGSRKSQD